MELHLTKDSFEVAKALSGDVIILGIGRAIDRGLLFFLLVMMGRVLGVDEYGRFSFAFALTNLVLVIGELGLNLLVNRQVARKVELASAYVNTGFAIRLSVSSVIVFLLCAVIWALQFPLDTVAMVSLLSLSLAIDSFYNILLAVFRACGRMIYQTVVIVCARGTIFILGTLMLLAKGSGVSVALTFPVGSLIALGVALYLYRRDFSKIRLSFDWPFWKQFVSSSFPLSVALIFGIIYFRVDTLLLSIFQGERSVGLYNAAYNTVIGTAIIAGAFMNALFPVMSRLYVSSIRRLYQVYVAALLAMSLMGLTIALAGTFFARIIITLLYGPEFMDSVLIFPLLSWGVCFLFMNSMTGNTMNAMDLQVQNMWIVGIAAVTNIVLNLILIPRFGYTGAAITAVSTQALIFVLGFIRIKVFFDSRLERVKA
jgi:O-antigen/teichoic acid export membrane protein